MLAKLPLLLIILLFMLAKLPLLLIILLLASLACAAPAKLYVSPKGNDAWNGKASTHKGADGPFATLAAARDAIRAMKQANALPTGGVTVIVEGGVYEMPATFELVADDSGTPEAPITYLARPGTEVRLVGGKQVTNFVPVTDQAVLSRLEPEARGKVMQADLKALGVTDFGHPAADGQRLELFFQDRPMKVSRWPNEGFAKIVDVVGGAPHKIHGIPGDKIGLFTYDGDRPERWGDEKDPWVHGYWFWDWADERQRIDKIDTQKKTIALKPPYHGYGYRKGAWWAAFNMLSEVDAPEEYYLDRDTARARGGPPSTCCRRWTRLRSTIWIATRASCTSTPPRRSAAAGRSCRCSRPSSPPRTPPIWCCAASPSRPAAARRSTWATVTT